jgi:hypothetical protein
MIEADNQETNFDMGPVRSRPVLLNVTSVGGKAIHRPGAGTSVTQNVLIRHGTNGQIYDLICMDGRSVGLDVQKTGWQAWDTTGHGANPLYWPYGTIRRDSIDVDYALFYNNGTNGLNHWADQHSKIGPWYPPPHSALCDTIQFDAVMLADPNLPHTADAWFAAGMYQDAKYNHPSDPHIRKILADNNTGVYDPKLWRPRQATEVDGRIDARPLPGSPVLNPANALPAGDPVFTDPFFHYVPYIGAFDVCDSTNHNNDWTWPWAEYPDK